MSEVKQIRCPHCDKLVRFKRNSAGKWIGTIVGGALGWKLAAGLGLAGAILGAPVAIPAALAGLGLGALIGNRAGSIVDNATVECPNCRELMSI